MFVPFDEVQICMITKDEEDVVEASLSALADFFPSFAILDQSSTDRTLEIIQDVLGKRALVITSERDFVRRRGFNSARNLISDACNLTWLLHIDADECLQPLQRIVLQELDGHPDIRFAAIERRNLSGIAQGTSVSHEFLSAASLVSTEKHTRLYLRHANLRWRSFIHEELCDEFCNATRPAPLSNIVIDHISCAKRPSVTENKEDFYSWMAIEGLARVGTDEELSDYARGDANHRFEYHKVRAENYARANGLIKDECIS